jgi:hypothetical protein
VGSKVVCPHVKALNSSIDNSAFTTFQPNTVGSKVTEITSGNCTVHLIRSLAVIMQDTSLLSCDIMQCHHRPKHNSMLPSPTRTQQNAAITDQNTTVCCHHRPKHNRMLPSPTKTQQCVAITDQNTTVCCHHRPKHNGMLPSPTKTQQFVAITYQSTTKCGHHRPKHNSMLPSPTKIQQNVAHCRYTRDEARRPSGVKESALQNYSCWEALKAGLRQAQTHLGIGDGRVWRCLLAGLDHSHPVR